MLGEERHGKLAEEVLGSRTGIYQASETPFSPLRVIAKFFSPVFRQTPGHSFYHLYWLSGTFISRYKSRGGSLIGAHLVHMLVAGVEVY